MAWASLDYSNVNTQGKCEIDSSTKLPVMDDVYFNSCSIYEKCKCLENITSSLDVLVKSNQNKYSSYLADYKTKYSQNNCDDVFKNYISTNEQDIYNSVTQADKLRIEADTNKQTKTRLYIGASVLLFVVGIIVIYGIREK